MKNINTCDICKRETTAQNTSLGVLCPECLITIVINAGA